MSPAARARAQNALGASSYSATNTAFPGGGERAQAIALLVLEALLVERPVERGFQRLHLMQVVLEPDREPAHVGRGRPGRR